MTSKPTDPDVLLRVAFDDAVAGMRELVCEPGSAAKLIHGETIGLAAMPCVRLKPGVLSRLRVTVMLVDDPTGDPVKPR